MAFGTEEWHARSAADNDALRRLYASNMEVMLAQNRAKIKQAEGGTTGSLADLISGVGAQANPFGAVPSVDTSNRFESGLGDAETRLRALLDNPDSVQQSAAYKFRVGQGQEALQRSLGARGLLNSGNRLMELTKYGQDMGSQEYENQAARLSSLLSTYGQGYLGDKNANTSRFSALANAWNTAQGNADQNRYRMGSLAWEMNKPQTSTSRSMSSWNPAASNLSHIGGYTPVDWSSVEQNSPWGQSMSLRNY